MSKTPITDPIPTSGQASWDGPLNALLQQLIDNCNARSGASDLDIQGDVTVNGNRIVDVLGVRVTVASSDPGVANSLFLSGTTPEWYLRDGNNNRIQVTAGGFLNNTSTAGFSGDFAASSAAASYANSTGDFSFTSTPGVYADMEFGAVRIHNGSSTGIIILQAPSGQASNVTLTLPSALNGDGCVISVDATGTLSANRNPILSGTIAGGGTFDVTGRMRTSGAAIVSGTLYQTSQVMWLDQSVAQALSPTDANGPTYDGNSWSQGAGAATIDYPIPLAPGSRITQIEPWINRGGSTPITASLIAHIQPGVSTNTVAQRSANTGSGAFNLTLGNGIGILTGTMPHVMVASASYAVRWKSAGGGSDTVYGIKLTWDRPDGT